MTFRQTVFLLIALAMVAALVACSSSSKTPTPPVVSITATSGSGQNAVVGAKFAAPLVATVTTGGSATSGATVTFTAPSSGASGTFANGTATETDTTNASGVATSSAFTANSTAGGPYTVTASVSGASTAASYSFTNTAAPVESIAATSGTPQLTGISTAFAAPLVATVTTGGSPNSGVTVTFTAPASGASGTFAGGANTVTATTDASGVATSTAFTANGTIGTYTVTAAVSGVSTPANFVMTNLVATTLANGTYVFSLAGEDQFTNSGSTCVNATNTVCGPYYVAGAFVVNAGTITSGEQDFINLASIASDPITGGTVATSSADGNLVITLTTADTNIGVSGVETLSATLVTSSTGVVTEFDASATSSGFLAQQTGAVAAPSGGYAFVAAGIDTNAFPVDIGGVIDVSGSTITTSGSVFDINDDGTVTQNQPFTSGTVTGPDSLGRVEFSLVPSGSILPINLVGYIVGPKHIWLVETGDSFQGSMGGEALGQGSNTGGFSNAPPLAGSSFVFGMNGVDNLSAAGAFQVAGVLTLNTDGTTVSGTLNFNDLTGTTTQSPIAVSGSYTVDPTGRVTVSSLTGTGLSGVSIQIYLSGFGDGTVASMDTGDVLAGLANQQTGPFTASSFSGSYAMNATGFDNNNELEFDANGPVSADGLSALTGTVDLNFMTPPGTQSPGAAVTGSFTANTSGVFTGTITGLDIDTAANNDAFTFYMIDPTKAIAIETDANQLTLIKFALQQ